MMLRTKAPEKMNVTAVPSTLIVGMTSMAVNVDSDFGIVTLSMNNKYIGSAYVENGTANISFPELTESGKAQIVVMGYNKVTEIIDIYVKPESGAYVVTDSYNLNQEDAQMDCNEYIDLDLNVKNIGVDGSDNISIVLSSTSEYIKSNCLIIINLK